MDSIKWLEHTELGSNKTSSLYYLDNKGNNMYVKYEVKFQYSLEDEEEIECYIFMIADGCSLPHRGLYENYFESIYCKPDKFKRVFFDLDKAKKYIEELIVNVK